MDKNNEEIYMLQKIRRFRKSVVALAGVAILTCAAGGWGIVSAQSDKQAGSHRAPVWAEVNRPIQYNPANPAPPEVRDQLVSLNVAYRDFDRHQHQGIIEVNRALEDDVITFFKYAYYLNFPINKVDVASNYNWDDNALMAADITSSFNYRTIAGTTTPSQHGLGRAFDVNPRENPYITLDDQGNPVTQPAGAQWLSGTPGTLHRDYPLVQLMVSRGWTWGGFWALQDLDGAVIDYQHFQKRAPQPAGTQSSADSKREL
jgi:D-alanyl-D-alanine carboxypeptidase